MSDNQELHHPGNIQTLPQQKMTTTPAMATPADIVLYAMQNGGSIEQIREFMQLQREWEADQARKQYVIDMAEFKRNPPEIIKDKAVGYTNKDGSFTGYKHATLGNVTNAIVEGLAKHGFSHRWDVKQTGAIAHVTCIITHRMGHSESVSMEAAKDDSGKKNAIQQVASAISYLQRYTLLLSTGLATHDQDDDGAAADGPSDSESLADEWIAKVNAAPTDSEVVKVWEMGSEKLEKARDVKQFNRFHDAVAARRGEFAAQAAKVAAHAKGGVK